MEQPRICIQNLGLYNEGWLSFKWLDLPVSKEDLEAAYLEIGINWQYEEVMIADWEFIPASTYDSIERLNEVAEIMEAVWTKRPELSYETLKQIMDNYGVDDLEYLIDDSYFIKVLDHMTEAEAVAYYFADAYEELQEDNFLTRHFNYDSWGTELMEDYYTYKDGDWLLLIPTER